jgi:hypothetical protein
VKRSPTAATPLTVLAPVRPGEEAELTAALDRMPRGEQSPFARLSSTHFARWVVVGEPGAEFPGAPWPARRLRMRYLLFTSTFNGKVGSYLEELRVRLGAQADQVWGHCVGYPGHHDPVRFRRYLRHNSVPVHLWYAAYQATVPEVRTALDLRDRHIAFAQQAQGMCDKQLLQAYVAHFGE